MADYRVTNEDEEKGKGGGGNKNALAYGLLQGEGINTNGLSPSEAWALVDQLHLMDREGRRKTDEEKKEYIDKNAEVKASGITKDSIVQKAGKFAQKVALHSDNIAGLNTAINTIQSIMNEYELNMLKQISTKLHIGKGVVSAAAEANGGTLCIGRNFLKNPSAFYRSSVENYKKDEKEEMALLSSYLNDPNLHPAFKDSFQAQLDYLRARNPFSRSNVCYKGAEVESVVSHEMGHVIVDQLCGQINGKIFLKDGISDEQAYRKQCLIENTYNEAVSNGDIKAISAYANKNSHEFFAEAFAMYKMGREKLPEKIEKMIVEVLS